MTGGSSTFKIAGGKVGVLLIHGLCGPGRDALCGDWSETRRLLCSLDMVVLKDSYHIVTLCKQRQVVDQTRLSST